MGILSSGPLLILPAVPGAGETAAAGESGTVRC